MRRWARSTNTTKATTARISSIRISAKAPFSSPVLTSCSVPPKAEGSPARMLARMIMEMPLPMPRSVICSPSHIRNTVPVVSVMAAVITKLGPGLMTTPWPCSATDMAIDWKAARITVK